MSINGYIFPFNCVNDVDLSNLFFGNQHIYPLSVLRSINFNPLNLSDDRLPVDNFMFNDSVKVPNSEYFFPNEFPYA